MRLAATLLAFGASLTLAAPALAQEEIRFGEDRPFVLSLEHLGGISRVSVKYEGEDRESATNAGTFFGFIPPFAPLPRLGLSYFVAPPLSLGAILHYADNDLYGETTLAGIRIGAGLPLADGTAIWIRGGIAYFSADFFLAEYTDVRPGGEVYLVLQPFPHFGFMVGGLFEMGIAGKAETRSLLGSGNQEVDYDYMEFGLSLGILADF